VIYDLTKVDKSDIGSNQTDKSDIGSNQTDESDIGYNQVDKSDIGSNQLNKSDIGSNQISKKMFPSRCSGSSYQLPATELIYKLHASVNQMIILFAESHLEPAESTPSQQTQLLSKIHPVLRTSYLLTYSMK
jgi:hypothetical protein